MTTKVPRGRPTGPTQEQANAFVAAEMAVQPGQLQRVERGDIPLAQDTSNFPVSQYPSDVATDTMMHERAKVVGGQNLTGQPVPVHYALSDKDFEFYAQKQAAQELAAFETWVGTQFNFKLPSEVERFARMFPTYFERRKAVLKNVSDTNLRYAEILLTGAQSAEDYEFLWNVQSGRIPLTQGPIWDPSNWFGGANANTAKLALFNPLKLFIDYSVADGDLIPNIPQNGNFFDVGIPTQQNGLVRQLFLDGASQNRPPNFSIAGARGGQPAGPYRQFFQ